MIKEKRVHVHRRRIRSASCSSGGAFYGLGFIGSLIYYISVAPSFWIGVIGILKSIVWPVFLIYGLFKFLGM